MPRTVPGTQLLLSKPLDKGLSYILSSHAEKAQENDHFQVLNLDLKLQLVLGNSITHPSTNTGYFPFFHWQSQHKAHSNSQKVEENILLT